MQKINLFFFSAGDLCLDVVLFICLCHARNMANEYLSNAKSFYGNWSSYIQKIPTRKAIITCRESSFLFHATSLSEPKSDVDLQNKTRFAKCFSFCVSSHGFKVGLRFIIVYPWWCSWKKKKKNETSVTLCTHVHNYMADDVDVVDLVRAILD